MSTQNLIKRKEAQQTEKAPSNNGPIKQRILNVASKIMNQKGFSDSSISEIALQAGVKDPAIYQYFKGKEDLLFSIVEHNMEKFLSFLDDQLQGLNGAHNKLRKLVWAHLRYNDVHREYITLVNLECRSNPNFYQTRAYQLIRDYAGILIRILNEGVEENVFRSGLNLYLVRDLIFGLLDFEAITCLITKEIREATPDHEDCMRSLERILLRSHVVHMPPKEKRHRILIAAVKAFAEKGYKNATISDIAQLAGIADGTVYEYFKNKEDLLLSIPEARFQEHLSQLEEAFDIRDPVRKLRRFIQYHFRLYLNDWDFLKVYLILILLNRRFYRSRAYDSLRQYVQILEELLRKGIDDGAFATDCNIRVVRNMFLGAFTHMVLRWIFLAERRNVDKIEEINEVTDLFTEAVVARVSEKGSD